MTHYDAALHVRGNSQYVDDVPAPHGMLHAAVFSSPVAHGKLKGLDAGKLGALKGVRAVITAADIPGENQIGAIIPDEELLATKEVHFIGHPIAVVVADTPEIARHAAKLMHAMIEVKKPVVCPREAFKRGHFIDAPRSFVMGDVDKAWPDCDVVVEGECDIAGQEHLYLETQRARATMGEGGRLLVCSSTQSPYAVQKAIARVCGVPSHMVEVDVRRLGGGFGGKEDQATAWACLTALACQITGLPVELVLNRVDDLQMTGKRHPYKADFKLGLDKDGQILAYKATLYQNSGAAADLSTAVLERSLFHATNAYNIPNVHVHAACCRTNLQPHTAFRGFGGPQGMFVIESAIAAAAEKMGVPRETLQRKNLLSEGDVLSYGQTAERCHAKRAWDEAVEGFEFAKMREEADAFNAANALHKKGLAIMPICFGIAFTKTFLNQASALVHVYGDGSVSVSTGGVEMGQGVNSKMIDIAARIFGISVSKIRVESTNTTRIANMSPSAASATADLNGNATRLAAEAIRGRLLRLASEQLKVDVATLEVRDGVLYAGNKATDWTWEKMAIEAYLNRVSLSEHAFYATPNIWFDANKEKGRPFAYHAYGAAIVGVDVDVLRGVYDIETVRIVHDLGRSVNEVVDLGQIEGGLAQGLGWMTLEELAYNDDGKLLSHALSTYKAPDVYFMPDDLQVRWITEEGPTGPFGSKAVGEPPLMYGIGVYFALRDAVRAARPDATLPFDAPMTPERVLMGIHPDFSGDETTRDVSAAE
ncbi:MAG: molybdopterin cofactor-binding domain-containing protein [bacterium]